VKYLQLNLAHICALCAKMSVNLTYRSYFITCFQLHVKNTLPWQHGLYTFRYLQWSSDHSSIILIKSIQNVLRPPSHTLKQTSPPLSTSNCSTDDLMVKSWPLLQESRDEVVNVTDISAVDHLLNVNISIILAMIYTRIGNFVEKVLIFMPLNCNCAKLAIFWRFSHMLRGPFFHGHGVVNRWHIFLLLVYFFVVPTSKHWT